MTKINIGKYMYENGIGRWQNRGYALVICHNFGMRYYQSCPPQVPLAALAEGRSVKNFFLVPMPTCRKAGGSYGVRLGYYSSLCGLGRVFGHGCLHLPIHAASPCGFVRRRAVLRLLQDNLTLSEFREISPAQGPWCVYAP